MCERWKTDPRFPKYPRIPVLECEGYDPRECECEWTPLDERATEYVREQLNLGRVLARACLDSLDEYRPWAHLPVGTPPESLYPLDRGGVDFPIGKRAFPAETLLGFLRAQDEGWQRIMVFEDPYAKPTDSSIVEGRTYTPVALFENDVLQIVTQPDDPAQLPVCEWPIIGVASRVPERMGVPDPGAEVDSEFIECLADQASALLVGAWDAENYVVLDRGLLAAVGVHAPDQAGA